MTTPAQQAVITFVNALADGEIEKGIALLSQDCQCWYTGAGDVTREEFVAGMRGMAELAEPGQGKMEIVEMIQEGDAVAVEYSSRIPLKSGKVYANTYHSKIVFKDGKITVMREYLNPLAVMEAFGAMNAAQ